MWVKWKKDLIILSGFSFMPLFMILCSCSNAQAPLQNRLAKATSPYLREHANNPVDWYEWSDEALDKAKKENKPILVSIGYSACHWCHVMEKESFMDTAVARIMNENFVCIKVDREERPDIDNVFIHACQLLNNGEAGWPLNAFALPNGKPFFAGTYYTKENWVKLLQHVSETYVKSYNKVALQANSIAFGILDNDSLLLKNENSSKNINKELYNKYFQNIYANLDLLNGGLKGRQKFPTPSLWAFLLQYYYRTKEQRALIGTAVTLTKMALGGMYDHVGGGFSRYSTDSSWAIPHFEKMLNDNAQLVSLYIHAYQVTRNELFKNVAIGTLEFLEREMKSSDGGFYSSLDADAEGREGDFYAWSANEIKNAAGKNSDAIFKYYHVSAAGNWQAGKNILHATESPAVFAAETGISAEKFDSILYDFSQKLLAKRNTRTKPNVDDKVLTSWNALMIDAYVDAYTAFGDDSYLKNAQAIASFIEKNMINAEGHVWRSFAQGKPSIDGFLDDYAFLAKAYVHLYEASFDKNYLLRADKLVMYAIPQFYDASSQLFNYSTKGAAKNLIQEKEVLNNVVPASNAVMAEVLASIGIVLDKESYSQMGSNMVSKVAGPIVNLAADSPCWGDLVGRAAYNNYEVAIVGKDALKKNLEMQTNYLPACLFLGGTEENLPLLNHKLSGEVTRIYVCTGKICKRPVEDVKEALAQIR